MVGCDQNEGAEAVPAPDKIQQQTGQTPGGFPDTLAAGNPPGPGGLEGELRNLKLGGNCMELLKKENVQICDAAADWK